MSTPTVTAEAREEFGPAAERANNIVTFAHADRQAALDELEQRPLTDLRDLARRAEQTVEWARTVEADAADTLELITRALDSALDQTTTRLRSVQGAVLTIPQDVPAQAERARF